MASPFTLFRKNQRAMMAAVMILCMVAFTIGGVASSMLDSRGSGSGGDPVVVTTVNGPVRETELLRMRETRRMLNRFMHEVAVTAYPEQFELYMWSMRNNISLDEQFGPDTEEDVVQTAVLADRAKRMGIVISDEAINEFLRERTSNKLTGAQFGTLVKNIGLSQPEVFESLRTVLSASRLARMTFFSTQVTPAQRWDYYRRLNQHAEAEVLPLDVEDFIDQQSDTSDEELRAFFEKHKETEPDPQSPEYGFKVPKKAAFRYFVAKYEAFVDEADVTDEEIKKHYEDNKDRLYRFTDLAGTADETTSESQSDAEEPAQNTPDAETPSKPEDESQTSVSAPLAPLLSTKQVDLAATAPPRRAGGVSPPLISTKQRDLAATAPVQLALYQAPLDKADAEATGAEASAADEADTADEPNTGGRTADDAVKNEPAADANPDGETSADEGAPNGDMPADGSAAGGDEMTPAETANEEPPARKAPEKRKPAKETQKTTPPPPQISSDLLLIRDIRQGPKPQHDPLWKVEASIRKELAGQKAVAKMKAELQSIQKEFRRYLRNLNDEDDQQLGEPNYAALAKQHGLEAHTTELHARYEMDREHPDLAGASLDQENPMAARRFGDVAYVMPLNQSHFLRDLEGNRYLFWKTAEEDAYVPKFEENRDDVLRAFKLQQARGLALEDARKKGEQASATRKPLADVFGEHAKEVKQTGSFSWMTASPMDMMHQGRAMPRLSEVAGVQSPGHDFMRTVFSLEEGGVGAALNHTQTMAYVVRVKSFSPSKELLHTLFMIQSYDKYEQAGGDDLRQAYKVWREGIEKEAQIEWKRPPDQPTVRTAMK